MGSPVIPGGISRSCFSLFARVPARPASKDAETEILAPLKFSFGLEASSICTAVAALKVGKEKAGGNRYLHSGVEVGEEKIAWHDEIDQLPQPGAFRGGGINYLARLRSMSCL